MTTDLGLILVTDDDRPDKCHIWTKHRASIRHLLGGPNRQIVERSYRVGTSYGIDGPTKQNLDESMDFDQDRAKLTTVLLNLNRQGVHIPEVTPQLIDRALAAPSLTVAERADRLLSFIGSSCNNINEVFSLGPEEERYGAMAWTESVNDGELIYIWNYIRDEMKWIKLPEVGPDRQYVDTLKDCIITPAGHARIAELSTRTDSAQAFVAMWFDDSMTDVYDDAIAPAIMAAGYDPFRVDREHFAETITDKIIAELRRSRFLVSDFTHGDGGVRGSVYYEAGFAHGLNIPVIFAAKDGTKPHFDTSTYPHIFWKPDDLLAFKTALTNRILALKELGPGPRST